MSKQLKQVINLSKRTGDRVIVFDNSAPEDSFMLMTLDQYEELLGSSVELETKKETDSIKVETKSDLSESREAPVNKSSLEDREAPASKNSFEDDKEAPFVKSSFEEEIAKRDAQIIKDRESQGVRTDFEPIQSSEIRKSNISDGPLKETLRNLLTEKKIVDKIDSIEKNNANLNGNKLNNWRIPPEVKEDSE